MLFVTSKTSPCQRVLCLPIGLFYIGFHLLIFRTILSSAMRSTWPNNFNLCLLTNPIIFCHFNTQFTSRSVSILQQPSSVLVEPNIFLAIFISIAISLSYFPRAAICGGVSWACIVLSSNSNNTQITTFMKLRPVGSELFRARTRRGQQTHKIWRSADRASWYILIIKPSRCTNFSNLFLE